MLEAKDFIPCQYTKEETVYPRPLALATKNRLKWLKLLITQQGGNIHLSSNWNSYHTCAKIEERLKFLAK